MKENEKQAIDQLFSRSFEYKGSDEFIKFVRFISKFNHYSRYNTMLVYLQNSAVTFFGGELYWANKFDRKVKEDARPYVILRPFSPVMLVYDIFETEGEKTPEEMLKDGLGTEPYQVTGQMKLKILEDAIFIAKSWGVKVELKPLSYFNAGYVTTIFKGKLEIGLKEGMSNEQHFSVLIHELAHLMLGHTGHETIKHSGPLKDITITQRKMSHTARELEAETVSYLICQKFGLATSSAEYLAGYIQSEKDIKEFSHEKVIRTADKIEKVFLSDGRIK